MADGSAYVHGSAPENAQSGWGGNGTSYSGGGQGSSACNYNRGVVKWDLGGRRISNGLGKLEIWGNGHYTLDLSMSGGLLIVYGTDILGTGSFFARGGSEYSHDNPTNRDVRFSSSGGGSINVFCEETDNQMKFKCDGDGYGSYQWRGGSGTYNFGTISNGLYKSIK